MPPYMVVSPQLKCHGFCTKAPSLFSSDLRFFFIKMKLLEIISIDEIGVILECVCYHKKAHTCRFSSSSFILAAFKSHEHATHILAFSSRLLFSAALWFLIYFFYLTRLTSFFVSKKITHLSRLKRITETKAVRALPFFACLTVQKALYFPTHSYTHISFHVNNVIVLFSGFQDTRMLLYFALLFIPTREPRAVFQNCVDAGLSVERPYA